MTYKTIFGTVLAVILLGGCTGSSVSDCGSEEAQKLVDQVFKEELEYMIQNELDAQKELGSYDITELDDAVKRLNISLADVRTSRDDPDSERSSCRASLTLELPDKVEKEANEVRSMAEMGTVRDLANRYKMKRRGSSYSTDFDYFIQPTDDGKKMFAEMDEDSTAFKFISETLASYLLADEIREVKIAEDQAVAEELREQREQEREEQQQEREYDQAVAAEGAAALNAAKVERDLASEKINAVWTAMPKSSQDQIEDLHSAWVQQMKARCKAQAAGSDERSTMRQARELACQTRYVRQCASTLESNVGNNSANVRYCRF